MIKAINKGYTITVTSWENDGDNYEINSKTVESLREARALYNLMQLCVSKNNTEYTRLGNTTDVFSDKQVYLLHSFFSDSENSILLEAPLGGAELKQPDSMGKSDWDLYITGLFAAIVDGLLGHSEWYLCRVMEKCVVTFSKEDVFVQEITFTKE